MVRRALTRQTRWYQNRCSIFKIKDFIVQKPFWKILEFWPLVTSFLTWAKKWPKWFRNDFSRAFERRFPFCSTMRRSRDRRGGVQTPPPPAGRGKSRGPAGRGLIDIKQYSDSIFHCHVLLMHYFEEKVFLRKLFWRKSRVQNLVPDLVLDLVPDLVPNRVPNITRRKKRLISP